MIISAVNSNRLGAYMLVLLCAIATFIHPLLTPIVKIREASSVEMPLWQIVESIVAPTHFLASFIILLFGIGMAFGIARFTLKHNLLNKQTALPAFMFVLCIALFPKSQSASGSWIAALALLVSSSLIYESYNKRSTAIYCFLAAFWMAVSSFFYYKTLFLFPLLFILSITVRSFNFKSLLSMFLGLLLPWYLYLAILYIQGVDISNFLNELELTKEMFFNFKKPPINAWISFIVFDIFVLMSVVSISKTYTKKKISIRMLYKVLIITVIYLVIAGVVVGYSFETMPIIAVPASILFAHFFDNMSSIRWQNILILLFMVVVAISQIMM